MPEKESECLDNGHDGKGNPHCRRGLRVDFPDKIRVGHHVKGCYQHADDGRYRQRTDEWRYGSRGHQCVLVFISFHNADTNVGKKDKLRDLSFFFPYKYVSLCPICKEKV